MDDGLELAYAEAGRGVPIVLLHGTLTTLEDMMIGLAGHLAPRHRVIAFDRPGFGRSTVRRFLDAGIWRQAERINAAVSALGLARPVLVGHSLGASVALAMAIQRPEDIAGVVALAPLAVPEPRLEHVIFGPRATPVTGDFLRASARATTDRSLFPLLWQAMWLPQTMPQRVVAEFPFALAGRGESSSRVGEDAVAAGYDLLALAAAAPDCDVPVRILGGDRDLVVNNGLHGRTLAALMPNGGFIDLPGLGHMAHHFATARIADVVVELASGAL